MASNYTIDDFYGDQGTGLGKMPVYSPSHSPSSPDPDQWDVEGGTCAGCSAQGAGFRIPIDSSQVHSGTWKSTTMDPGEPLTTISVQFRGTYTVNESAPIPPDSATISSSASPGSSGSSGSTWPLPVHITTQLPTSSSNPESPSQQSPTPSPPSHKDLAGPIAGAVVGTIVFIIILCALICCLWRRRHRQISVLGGRRHSALPAIPLPVTPLDVTARLVLDQIKHRGPLHPSVPWNSMYTVENETFGSATETQPPQSVMVPSSTSQSHTGSQISFIRNIRREILELRAELDRVRASREGVKPRYITPNP
ncbi:hypothetical protein PHLCEN_2v11500 [Hermanssonia centrifuga]|uniref:Uncharacterized protein n=1 Tax=Hermanssonia centrifuga TaxID=98765 RepID=A0A2R6NJU4_9APHY|nr:hypothetical protein PHLCEN_2v11500 [Hermanssonia centrifuga]